MRWFSQLLVTTLVAAGIFVAVASGCQSSLHLFPTDGGSCSETQIGPTIPDIALSGAPPVFLRFELIAILAAVIVLSIPRTPTVNTTINRALSRGSPGRVQFALRD